MALLSCATSSADISNLAAQTPALSTKKQKETIVPSPHLLSGFVYVDTLAPDILVELRYTGHHNFVGRPIAGYLPQARAILSQAAGEALAKAQREAVRRGFTLKIYDAYRPQKAVQDFLVWSHDPKDNKMQAEFYPNLDKRVLFEQEYISARSGHSRGSTVDLTLVALPVGQQESYTPGALLRSGLLPYGERFKDNSLDMGSGFDVFDEQSHTECPNISATARHNRQLLVEIMGQAGFVNFFKEWWHFTLEPEPYPTTYFDFDVGAQAISH